MKKVVHILGMLVWGSVISAMDVQEVAYEGNTTAAGEIISVENLQNIAKKDRLPGQALQTLKAWLRAKAEGYESDSDNQALVKILAQFPSPVSQYKEQAPLRRSILKYFKEKQNLTTYDSLNYLCEVIPNYVLRIGGIANRIYSYIAGHTLPTGRWLDPWGTEGQALLSTNKAG